MIEKFFLPNEIRYAQLTLNRFARPFLPESDENRERLRIWFG